RAGGRARTFSARGVVTLQQGETLHEGKAPAPADEPRPTGAVDSLSQNALGVSNDRSSLAPPAASPAPEFGERLMRQSGGDRRIAADANEAPTAGAVPAEASKSVAMYKQLETRALPASAAAPAQPPLPAEPNANPMMGRPMAGGSGGGAMGQPKAGNFVTVTAQQFAVVPFRTEAIAALRKGLSVEGISPNAASRNDFAYSVQPTPGADPIAVALEVAACPWAPEHRLLRVGLAVRNETEAGKKEIADAKGNLDGFSVAEPGPKNVNLQIEFNPAQALAYRFVSVNETPGAAAKPSASSSPDLKAGEAVTALCEIIPAQPKAADGADIAFVGKRDLNKTTLDRAKEGRREVELKPATATPETANPANELLTLDVGWTDPESGGRLTRSFPLNDSGRTLNESSPEFRWSAAVATFGFLLENSPDKGSATWKGALKLGEEAKGLDPGGERQKVLDQMEKASKSAPSAKPK
ncbi:MAG TPA: YfbK domain-containing protein, partial [Chthoniobacteraceae bacterium]